MSLFHYAFDFARNELELIYQSRPAIFYIIFFINISTNDIFLILNFDAIFGVNVLIWSGKMIHPRPLHYYFREYLTYPVNIPYYNMSFIDHVSQLGGFMALNSNYITVNGKC